MSGREVIRHAFFAALVLVVAAAACGSFGSDTGRPTQDGGTDEEPEAAASSSGGEAGPADATEGAACVSSQQSDWFDAGLGPGWSPSSVITTGATLKVDGPKGTVVVNIDDTGVFPARAYYKFEHPQTPCAGGWKYQLKFRANTKDRGANRLAGPRLGGVLEGLDKGIDGHRNQVGVGFSFIERHADLILSDDACNAAPCIDAGPASAVRVASNLPDGWHDFVLLVTVKADGNQQDGYGTIEVGVDGALANGPLRFPLQAMKIETYFGVWLTQAKAKATLELDNAEASFTPN